MIWLYDYGHDIIIWLWSLTIGWPELPLFRGHLELRRCCCFLIFISVYESRYKRRSCYIQPHSDWKKARIWFSYKFKLVVFSQYIPLSLLRRQAIESTVYGLISTYRLYVSTDITNKMYTFWISHSNASDLKIKFGWFHHDAYYPHIPSIYLSHNNDFSFKSPRSLGTVIASAI